MLVTPVTRRAWTRRAALVLGLLAGLLAPALDDAAVAETAPPATPPAKPAPAGTRAMVVESQAMDAIIGKTIKSATGEDLGRLTDVLVDPAGATRAAVVDYGGVLGVGSRAIAVDWRALDFSESAKNGVIKLMLTRDQIRVAPLYRAGEPVVIMEPTKAEEPAKAEQGAKPAAAVSAPAKSEASRSETSKPDVTKPDASSPSANVAPAAPAPASSAPAPASSAPK